MSKTVNKLYKHNATVYKVILFLVTASAIVYFFPKGGQFKYDFSQGKPWQYNNLIAPFDFAIEKTQEELEEEIVEKNKEGTSNTTDSVQECPTCGSENPIGSSQCILCGFSFVQ